ncbi:MAG: TIR domain-containing protein [Candidatus Poribacteria bacterium]|nr:TIR domain-containing protein [Candidatus Poribacteria bacterium]
MSVTPRHTVFITFHHEDQEFRDWFVDMLEGHVVDRSVGDGDIDDWLSVETIRRKIRDEFIADATVTIVLIGKCTWRRKYVDWEIGSSLRDTEYNPRCGLLGIFLPTHPDYKKEKYRPWLMPPRLAENCVGRDPYAKLYDWSQNTLWVQRWIHRAFLRRDRRPPSNSTLSFVNNRGGSCYRGWQ